MEESIGENREELLSMAEVPPDCIDSDFETIYRAYKPLMRSIARRNGIPTVDADDRIHDVFASYILHRSDVRDPGPYLIGAIRNSSREYWRSQNVQRGVFCDGDTSTAHDEHSAHDSDVIVRASVRATLAALGPSCRAVLRSYYLEGESASDIAGQRQTTPGYIHRLLNYCRRRAQALYQSLSRIS